VGGENVGMEKGQAPRMSAAARLTVTFVLLFPVASDLAHFYLQGRSNNSLGPLVLFLPLLFMVGILVLLFSAVIIKVQRKQVPVLIKNLIAACFLLVVWSALKWAVQPPLYKMGTRHLIAQQGGTQFIKNLRLDADRLVELSEKNVFAPDLLSVNSFKVEVHKEESLVVIRTLPGPPRPGHGWIVFANSAGADPVLPDIRIGSHSTSQMGEFKVAQGVYRY
jgi:hypothetical protein